MICLQSPLFIALHDVVNQQIAEYLYAKGAVCTVSEQEDLDFNDGLYKKFLKRMELRVLDKMNTNPLFNSAPHLVDWKTVRNKTERPKSQITLRGQLGRTEPHDEESKAPLSPLRLPSVPQDDPIKKLAIGKAITPQIILQFPNEQVKTAENLKANELELQALAESSKQRMDPPAGPLANSKQIQEKQAEFIHWEQKCKAKQAEFLQWDRQCKAKLDDFLRWENQSKSKQAEFLQWEQQCAIKKQGLEAADVNRLEKKIIGLKQNLERVEETNAQYTINVRKLKEQIEKQTIEEKKSKKVKEILLLTRKLKLQNGQDLSDDFKLVKKLGGGCSGLVFLVETTVNNQTRQFALKMILNFHQVETKDVKNYYQNELEILHSLTDIHPNIIHIISECTTRPTEQMISHADSTVMALLKKRNAQTSVETPCTTKFFLTEYHKSTLQQVYELEKFSVERVYRYARDLLDCFAFLYHQHIVHRDVKMNNIMVSVEDHLILIDFGESLKTDIYHCCSRSVLTAGNMKYLAPEVRHAIESKAETINFSGQYSWEVGCLLHEIFSGKWPFSNDYPEHSKKVVEPQFGPEFDRYDDPVQLKQLIGSMLAGDVSLRIGIKEALDKFDHIMWYSSID